tara:strand:+ start:2710 stop:2886 length:177 start_codon:yes stop_codon:yes gene_type:complete
MDLVDKAKKIINKKKSDYPAGSVNNIFVYHDMMEKDASGMKPVFIKPEPENRKVKSIN